MKKLLLAPVLLLCLGTALLAQQTTKPKTPASPKTATVPNAKEEKKEIVIEKKEQGKSEKTVIVIDGGNVTINGKPASEYKGKQRIVIDDDIVINGNVVRVPGARSGVTIHKAPPRAFLGVSTQKHEQGALVTEVVEGSAAEKAGLKKGDIITSVGDAKVSDSETLLEAVKKQKPDATVDITYLRDDAKKKVKATLGKTDDAMAYTIDDNFMKDFEHNFKYQIEPPMAFNAPRVYGFRYPDDRPKFGMGVEDNADGDGAKVNNVEPESQAAKAGLQKDDIITEVEGTTIKTVDNLREELAKGRDKSVLSIKVQRAGKTETLSLRVPKKIRSAEL